MGQTQRVETKGSGMARSKAGCLTGYKGFRRRMNSSSLLLIITVLLFLAMYLGGCVIFADKGFPRLQTFFNILINNAGLLIVACGVTCVMLTGGIDISVGSLVAMNCMFLAVGMEHWGLPSPVLMVLVLLMGVAFGSVQGYCVAYLGIQPFIVTMAGLFFARGMTSVICTKQVSIVSDKIFVALANRKVNMPFGIGGYENKKGILQIPYVRVTVVAALIVVVLVFLMLRYTRFGRSLYAVGGSQASAALMGLNVRRTRMLAHVLCSFLTSLGSICFCLNTMSGTATQAVGLEMDAISSSIIGGTLLTGGVGNVLGTFFGVLVGGTISTLVKSHGRLISSWSNIITALLLCFFIVLQAVFTKIKTSRKKSL